MKALVTPAASACGAALLFGVVHVSAGAAAEKPAAPIRLAQAAQGGGGGGEAGRLWVYIGTYSQKNSKGIYRSELDLATGKLSAPVLVAETANPSFLAIHPNRRFLYAVNEVDNFQGNDGAVSAFAIDQKTGGLTFLNQQRSHGAAPCHLIVDKAGKNVLVANYTGGSIASLPIQADGKLGEATSTFKHTGPVADARRQGGPHAHSIHLDAANRFAFAADLGLDKILVYRFDGAAGKLTPHEPPFATLDPRSGPRHFAFHPGGRYAYVINEISKTVTAFSYDPSRGVLTTLHSLSTVPEGTPPGGSTAEILVHPSGKFVYGSNRGHDSIAVFTVDPSTGRLSPVQHQSTLGRTPRNFAIDPTGRYLVAENQASDSIVVFRIDQESGKLTPTGEKIEAPIPVCVRFMRPRGQ